MDGQQDQRPGGRNDEPMRFSMRIGDEQPTPNSEQPFAQPGSVPPPLTPVPQMPSLPVQRPPTPYPQYQQPSQPGAPGYPMSQGGFNYHQAMPPIALAPSTPAKQPSALGRPFPAPLSLAVFFGCIVLLALVFAVRVLALGGDWSDGAFAVGVAAMALAAITAIVAVMRTAAGRRTFGFGLLAALLLLSLLGTGVAGIVASPTLHAVQARAMEQNGQWGDAIHEYALSGQSGSNATDIARVQDAWGEQLLQQKDYANALTHFQTVLDDYQNSGQDVVSRAQKGQFNTYAAWLQADPTHVPYRDAIDVFANFANNSACDSNCKTTLGQAAPQAYYLYGTQLLTQKKYTLAITEFEKLASQYGSSAYAAQGHAKAATAYLAYGQQQIASQECSGAVSTYTTLVAKYKGTPEASQAQTALRAPQNVTGSVSNPPTNPTPTMHLSKQMNFNAFFFSNEYSASVDAKSGAFTFKLVAQGTYYISMSRPVSGGIDYTAWWADTTHSKYYSFTVAPLCPFSIGNLP